jgi:glyoxylase-like metal-dependent hydrolase (beta-lactamase superfamily II)
VGSRSLSNTQEIAPGLRRWTAWHDHWEEQVGSVAVDTADGLVLIDPLDPPADLPSPKHVLLTLYYHARAAAGLKARVWAPARSQRPLRNRGVEAEDAAAGELPGGIVPFPTARAAESVYWLPEHRAVVVGDVLLGAGAKPRATDEPLRLCPQRWLGKSTHEQLRRSLLPLLDLPVEHVLVSHGLPVVDNGKRELARVLA